MTKEIAEKIAKGITDKIEAATTDIDDWAEFWGFTREDYEEFLEMPIKYQKNIIDDHYWKGFHNGIRAEKFSTSKREACEDAVSRKEVLGLFAKNVDAVRSYSQTWEEVKELSSVTPIQKKGKWTNGDPICPCCGEDKFKDLDADIWSDWQPKYCPNCGSLMESEWKC